MKTCKLPFLFYLVFSMVLKLPVFAQTLSPGDIAFVGFQSDDPDKFSFVALNDIPASTTIHITENGWLTTGGLRSNSEGTIVWQSPDSILQKGATIHFTNDSVWIITFGSVTQEHSFALSASNGDQLLAFQVNATDDTTFIAAINFNGDSWNVDQNSPNDSDIPLGLTNLDNAVAIPEKDNGFYSGPTNGTVNFLRSAINNPGNWTTSNSILTGWPTSFTISDSIIIDAEISVKNLNISSSEVLVIENSGALTVTDSLGNSGKVLLKSDNSGTGIINATAIGGPGTATVERYIPDYNWHIISSPVSGQSISAFATVTPLETDPDGGATTYDLAPYNEPDNSWGPYFPQSGGSGTFETAGGYALRLNDNTGVSISFTGTLQSDTINKSLTLTPPSGLGWHALGNPYTAPIVATNTSGAASWLDKNASKLNNLFTAVYVWNDNLVTPGWETYNNTSDFALAPCQGFIVCTAANGNEVVFDNSIKSNEAATFKSEFVPWQKLKITASCKDLSSSTELAFKAGMSAGLDVSFDAGLFEINPDFQLCSKLMSDKLTDLAIQALPEISQTTQRIPLVFYADLSGDLSIEISSSNLDSVVSVVLEDSKQGTFTPFLNSDSSYKTSISEFEENSGRFYLLVNKQELTSAKQPMNLKFNVYAANKTIYIRGNAQAKTRMELFSLDGKLLKTELARNENINQMNVSRFREGIYLLRISSDNQIQTTKIYIK